jgi:hypothetical protein
VRLAIGPAEKPVAGHSEMRVQCGTIIEMHQLMLSTALDANDPALAQQLRFRVGKLSRE